MLLDRFYKPSEDFIFFTLLVIFIFSAIIILIYPFIYLEVFTVNFIVFLLWAVFFKRALLYSIFWSLLLLCLLNSWQTTAIGLNKLNYYNIFKPLMKYRCLAGFDLIKNKITNNYKCNQGLTIKERMEIIAFQKNNEALIQHFKKLGCYLIEISDAGVQFWFTDVVIGIDKNKDNEINYYVSQLE